MESSDIYLGAHLLPTDMLQFSSLSGAIVRTVCYADIFEYPLTIAEIHKWLIHSGEYNLPKITAEIDTLRGIVGKKNNLYFLKGREHLVSKRERREEYAKEKLYVARKVTARLAKIPTILLVGITGSLAMNNTDKTDDIDLFIITRRNTVWMTRCLSTLLVEIQGQRRHPKEKNAQDKVCLNMYVDEGHILLPSEEQDIFSAHEILQMKPLWQKEGMYKRFIQRNTWVEKHLANGYQTILRPLVENSDTVKTKEIKEHAFLEDVTKLSDSVFHQGQVVYMAKRRTNEILKNGFIRFHPTDAREWILREYQKRLQLFIMTE